MFDVGEADAAWPNLSAPQVEETGDPDHPPEAAVPMDVLEYGAARAAKETWLARLRQQEYEVKSGALVRTEEVQSEWFRALRVVRDRFINLPDRLADQLAVEDDAAVIHRMLSQGIREVLEAVADEIADSQEAA